MREMRDAPGKDVVKTASPSSNCFQLKEIAFALTLGHEIAQMLGQIYGPRGGRGCLSCLGGQQNSANPNKQTFLRQGSLLALAFSKVPKGKSSRSTMAGNHTKYSNKTTRWQNCMAPAQVDRTNTLVFQCVCVCGCDNNKSFTLLHAGFR